MEGRNKHYFSGRYLGEIYAIYIAARHFMRLYKEKKASDLVFQPFLLEFYLIDKPMSVLMTELHLIAIHLSRPSGKQTLYDMNPPVSHTT